MAQEGSVVVIGGGRFGRLAVERLGRRVALVVEPEPDPELLALGATVVREDGIAYLVRLLEAPVAEHPAWVVPMLPRHLVGEWLFRSLLQLSPRFLSPPRECLPPVASLMEGEAGQFYLSLADFLCPDDCPEPAEVCTVTGKPRGEPMFSRLGGMNCPGWRVAVLRSRQLAPGVGGLRCGELLELRERLVRRGGRWVVATACRCHGVAQGLVLEEVRGGA